MFTVPRSAITNVSWPAVPNQEGALLLALLRQFEDSERLPADQLEALQFRSLAGVLRHACDTVDYYRDRTAYREVLDGGSLDAEAWRRLPVLTRADLQEAGESLHSHELPSDHLPVKGSVTSGSTGRPAHTLSTRVTSIFWHAITLRDHVWHGRDGSLKMVVIRAEGTDTIPPEGLAMTGWGAAIGNVFPPGPCARLGISHDIAYQAEWLTAQNPDYLLSLPSNLCALARYFERNGRRLPRLRQVTAYGETLGPDVRTACRDAWGVEVTDMYSSAEIGYVALQCPETEGLHVQSETVYVEVVDDDGRPCQPGEVGKVLVSTMHNYAMPLFRYEVGDFAEVGDPCPCGRTLPLLARVVGRKRNMLHHPTGELMWPRLPAHEWAPVAPILQLQLVQDQLDHIEARMVTARPLTALEESDFTAVLQRILKYPFRVTLTYLDRVDRTRERKFDDFISRL